jgi:RNA polymerase sigma factor (sigma-70 family)
MLTKDDEFAELVARIKQGSEAAMFELVEKYGQHVYRTVRRKLSRAMRSKFDSADFVQAVWASFFENRDRLLEFPSAQDLIQFLSRIAHNKVVDEIRRRLVLQGKNVNREVPIDRAGIGSALFSPGPTVSEVVMADERAGQITTEHSARYRRIVELRRAGATHVEIAEALGVNPKTVQRVLQRLQRETVT